MRGKTASRMSNSLACTPHARKLKRQWRDWAAYPVPRTPGGQLMSKKDQTEESELDERGRIGGNLNYEGRAGQATQETLEDKIDQVLKTLTYREREIIKLRYGLGGKYTYTLEEVARIF